MKVLLVLSNVEKSSEDVEYSFVFDENQILPCFPLRVPRFASH